MPKPAIALHAPAVLFVGQQHRIEIELTPESDMRVDYIEARLFGNQGWEVGSGKSRVTHEAVFPRLISRLMERGVLPARSNRFAVQFELPYGVAPTHSIDPAHARFEIHVRIGVPWWFDVKYHYMLPVRLPPPAVVQRTPLALRSTSTTAAADQPRIEISLASTRLVAGEVVTGSCAVFHLDDKKPRQVELSLVPSLVLMGRGRIRERTGQGIGMALTLPAGSAGTSVPFELLLPATITPSFETITHKLSWMLFARSGSFFGGKVELAVPLAIVDRAAAATTAKLAEAPRLADERVAALFARFAAAAGWHGGASTADHEHTGQIAVERDAGSCSLRLGYAYRDDGTFVIGRITGPSLGLGLVVTPSSSLRHVFWKDIEVDIDAWDRAHHVVARFADQALPLLAAVVPTLQQVPELGTLVRWTDDELVFERAIANVEGAELAAMGDALARVATTLDTSRSRVAAPPCVVVDATAWQDLARWLDGELVLGNLSIEGKLGQIPVHLGLELDAANQPTAIYATAGNPDDASAATRAVTLSLAHPAADVLGANVAEALVDLLTRWPANIMDLHVTDGTASARLAAPVVETGVVAFDAARVRELVLALAAVLSALEPGAGPYR